MVAVEVDIVSVHGRRDYPRVRRADEEHQRVRMDYLRARRERAVYGHVHKDRVEYVHGCKGCQHECNGHCRRECSDQRYRDNRHRLLHCYL